MYLIGFKGVWANRKTQPGSENANGTNTAVLLDSINDKVSITNRFALRRRKLKPRQNEGCDGLRLEGLMTPKEELKQLVANMNDEQFKWFVDQMRLLLSEQAV